MLSRNLLWIAVPVALSIGVIWLSAQDGSRGSQEGVRMGELAEKVQTREKAVTQKETELAQLERRLNTIQATLLQERQQLQAREKAIEDEKAKIKEELDKFEIEKKRELERLRELEKSIEAERLREVAFDKVDPQLIRAFEAMDPAAAGRAIKELATINIEVAVSLLAEMQPKKVALVFNQLATSDAKLTAVLSERVAKIQREAPKR